MARSKSRKVQLAEAIEVADKIRDAFKQLSEEHERALKQAIEDQRVISEQKTEIAALKRKVEAAEQNERYARDQSKNDQQTISILRDESRSNKEIGKAKYEGLREGFEIIAKGLFVGTK